MAERTRDREECVAVSARRHLERLKRSYGKADIWSDSDGVRYRCTDKATADPEGGSGKTGTGVAALLFLGPLTACICSYSLSACACPAGACRTIAALHCQQ